MTLMDWLKGLFGGKTKSAGGAISYTASDDYADTVGDIYIREMAFWSAVNLVSRAVSKCEFKTFQRGKEVKGKEYYLWNVEPNRNQNSTEFLQQLVAQLYRKNEAIVIEVGGALFVADDFDRDPYVIYEDVFKNVVVKDLTFDRSFKQSEVLYFRLNNVDMRAVINNLYGSYSKLISYSMKAFQRSRGVKGKFKYDALPSAGTEDREMFDKLINERMSKWLTSDSAALPLGRGQDFEELQHKTYASESTRDIRAQIDDIFDFTAKALGIPAALLRGDVQGTSDAVDNLLTFCIDPLIDMLSEEINRKRYGYSGFARKDFIKIDGRTIKHIDILSVANEIDKLIRTGVFSVNDIREIVGEQRIDEPWADAHYVTKNYETIDAAGTTENGLKGGE